MSLTATAALTYSTCNAILPYQGYMYIYMYTMYTLVRCVDLDVYVHCTYTRQQSHSLYSYAMCIIINIQCRCMYREYIAMYIRAYKCTYMPTLRIENEPQIQIPLRRQSITHSTTAPCQLFTTLAYHSHSQHVK